MLADTMLCASNSVSHGHGFCYGGRLVEIVKNLEVFELRIPTVVQLLQLSRN